MSVERARAGLRSALVLFSVFVLQVGVFDGLRVFGRAAEPLLALAVAGGLVGGWWRGLRLGFAAGLLYDVVAGTPLGLAAFAYALVAAGAGLLQGLTVRLWWLVPPFSALGLCLYVLAGEVVGQDHLYNDRFWVTLAVVESWAVVLAAPTLRLVRWAWSEAPAPPRAPRAAEAEVAR
ncbi:MAG: hypothetical protein OXG47_06420 [bacterium]|nr:hypothetical protein [bacterium]MCY3925796.1 hypothetical protein [bacterium]